MLIIPGTNISKSRNKIEIKIFFLAHILFKRADRAQNIEIKT